MKQLKTACAGFLFMASAGCSVVGIRTVEEAAHKTLVRDGAFSVRQYSDAVIAETFVETGYGESGSTGFRRLAGYIFGKNKQKQKIAMTAPVVQERASEKIAMTAPVLQEKSARGWRMAFVLPSKLTIDTAPEPSDPNVTVRKAKGKKVAVVRYSGRLRETRIEANAAKLKGWIEANGYKAISDPVSAGYDPPWTLPFLRRNEVQVEIE